MLSIFFVVIGLSLLILVHEFGHFLAARWFGLIVEEFGVGFPPRLFAKKIKGTVFSLNLIPLGGFVRIYGEHAGIGGDITNSQKNFAYQLPWKRAVITGAGVVMNFLLGWLIISGIFLAGSPSVTTIRFVQPDSPAETAGLKAGDEVLGYKSVDKLIEYINNNQGKEITLNVKRDGQELELQAVPRIDFEPGEGALGVGLQELGIPKHDFISSVGRGFVTSVAIIGAVVTGLYQVFSEPQQVVGPVGIVDLAVGAGESGMIYLFQFLALISLNLVILNLLPIPALDGGRLLFIAIEKIRGKRLLLKTETIANAVGFSLLIGLIVLITIKDVLGLLGG